jgi:hypothetical protein
MLVFKQLLNFCKARFFIWTDEEKMVVTPPPIGGAREAPFYPNLSFFHFIFSL